MAKHTKKSTRKFERTHLKSSLEGRKESKKIKKAIQEKAKKQAKRAQDAEANGDDAEGQPTKQDAFSEMTVDQFFQGGFEIPQDPNSKSSKSKQPKEKLGKRKRTEPAEESDEDASSDDSEDDAPVMGDSDDESAIEDVGMSKEAMDALAEKDPEFYKFLQENDPEALDFDENADLAEVDELSESETEQPRKKQKTSKKPVADAEEPNEQDDASDVTAAMVAKWKKAMTEQHSLRAMRQVVLAFRAAAHINEDTSNEYKYTVSSPEVYHQVLVTALEHIPDVLNHHLPVKESASGKVHVAMDSKKFKSLSPLLKSHITSILHLLGNLSDAPTLKLTLTAIVPLLPYIFSFKKVLKVLVKTVVDIWSDTTNSEATCVTAFLVIRRLMVIGDPGIREATLKTVYQGLVKGARNTSIHTLQAINLMKNSAAELWGIDQITGYTTGFTFIRQLAIHLRSSITNPTKDSYKTIYNWQYVHSLDFWSCVLSEHCNSLKEAEQGKESQLRPLIYPTVQVTLGALRLIPTATYFPLRFHLTRSLLRLSRATGTYIPLAASLIEVLNSAEMKKPPKPSTLKSLDFATAYKAPKSYLRTRVYQDGVGEQVVELLAEFFGLWCKSIAFPELTLPVIVMLKRWMKETSGGKHGHNPKSAGKGKSGKNSAAQGNKNSKINSALAVLVQKLEANAKYIEERRAKVEFAPNDRAGVDGFLRDVDWETTPLGVFVVTQRKSREEKRKMLEEARKDDERKRAEDRKKAKEDDEVSEDEEEDEDDDEMSGLEAEGSDEDMEDDDE